MHKYTAEVANAARDAYARVEVDGEVVFSEARIAEFDAWLKGERRNSARRAIGRCAAAMAMQGQQAAALWIMKHSEKIRTIKIPEKHEG